MWTLIIVLVLISVVAALVFKRKKQLVYKATLESGDEGKEIKNVLIAGGGIGGLVLGRLLQRRGINFTIYERDTNAVDRYQGYHLGINDDGMSVLNSLEDQRLKALLAKQEPRGFSVLEGDSLDLLVQFGDVYRDYSKNDPNKPALIDRKTLRQELTNSLSDHIVWDKHFDHYDISGDQVTVTFKDSTTATGDLLVGADGVKSKIRLQKCPALKLEHTHVFQATSVIPVELIDFEKIPKMHAFLKNSCVRTLGRDGKTFLLMLVSVPEPVLYCVLSWHKDSVKYHPTQEQTQDFVRDESKKFHEEVQYIVNCIPSVSMNKEYDTIVPMSENPLLKAGVNRVTLLGDAAHAMTSHAGLGANTAIRDAMDLADALERSKNKGHWVEEIAEYNQKLIERGFSRVKFSRGSTDSIHSNAYWRNLLMRMFFRTFGLIFSVKRNLFPKK